MERGDIAAEAPAQQWDLVWSWRVLKKLRIHCKERPVCHGATVPRSKLQVPTVLRFPASAMIPISQTDCWSGRETLDDFVSSFKENALRNCFIWPPSPFYQCTTRHCSRFHLFQLETLYHTLIISPRYVQDLEWATCCCFPSSVLKCPSSKKGLKRTLSVW